MKLNIKSKAVLLNMLIAAHPDEKVRQWMLDEQMDTAPQERELLDAGLIEEKDGSLVPTKKGIKYFQNSENTDIRDLIQQIKNVVPKNPSFQSMAVNLTDTAIMGSIYTLLGEIGRRGYGDQAEYWQGKIIDLQKVLKGATPDTLWEKHQKKQEKML